MGGCFPCFESSNKEVEGRNGVKGGDEENKEELVKEGSAAASRVSLGILSSFPFFFPFFFFILYSFF